MRQPLAHPSPSAQRDGEEKWTKGETHGLRKIQFNKTKEILILLILLMLLMNMQNKPYTIQFHCPTTNCVASA